MPHGNIPLISPNKKGLNFGLTFFTIGNNFVLKEPIYLVMGREICQVSSEPKVADAMKMNPVNILISWIE
jgi:hypothetical protein